MPKHPEQQTMNTVIHAALRRDLARFDEALGAFPADSRARAEQLSAAWDNTVRQLHQHHDDEESIFWPALRQVGIDGSLMADLEGEHEGMRAALTAAKSAMAAFSADPSGANAAAARVAVGELRGVLLEHLEHEERDLEPVLAQNEHTAPVKEAQKRVRKAHKGNAGVFVAWLRDDADPGMRAVLDRSIPRPVQFVMVNTSGRRYARTVSPAWS